MLPTGPRVAIIGSTTFWQGDSEDTCVALGRSLASLNSVVLLTGGVDGVGEAVGRSFWSERLRLGLDGRVFHILPHDCDRWDYGDTIFAGSDMGERREILGRLAEVYVAIEGGPGTAQEAAAALARAAVVIPVGRSGGHAEKLYPLVDRPPFAEQADWETLTDVGASPERTATAVTSIVSAYLRST